MNPPALSQRSPYEFALGLGKLHWGMTTAEAKRMFPAVRLVPDNPLGVPRVPGPENGSQWGPSLSGLTDHDYAGCSFELNLRFYLNRLDSVFLTSPEWAGRCRTQVEQELVAQYGQYGPNYGSIRQLDESFARASWLGPSIRVGYDVRGARFGAGSGLSVAFTDGSDINVRRVAEECQSIVVELLPDSRDDGTSNPILAELPYLGCNYPPISTLLQEEGSIVLSIQVLADGTVGSVQVSTPLAPHA